MKKYEVTVNFHNENVTKLFEAENPDDAARKSRDLMKKCAYAVWETERPFDYDKFLTNLESMLDGLKVVSIKELS